MKTPRFFKPETYVITHNRLNTHLVLFFSDLNKTQIYKRPYSDSPYQENEIVMSFNYLNVFKPNEYKEDSAFRKQNNEHFLFETGDKKYIYVGEKVFFLKQMIQF